MLKLDEIKSWFDDFSKIIFEINVSIENIKRMAFPKDEYEERVLAHGFFMHIYRQLRFTIIIQLCKILVDNDNQKRNLHKFINRLKTDKYDNQLEDLLFNHEGSKRLFTSRNDIQKELELLEHKIAAHRNSIDKIVILRNKFYAHSDVNTELPIVSNEELESLIKLAVEIYNSLYGKLLDAYFVFDHISDWKIDHIIKVLALHNKDLRKKPTNRVN
jgi:hypothetical protein